MRGVNFWPVGFPLLPSSSAVSEWNLNQSSSFSYLVTGGPNEKKNIVIANIFLPVLWPHCIEFPQCFVKNYVSGYLALLARLHHYSNYSCLIIFILLSWFHPRETFLYPAKYTLLTIYEIKVYFVGWFWDPNQKQSFPDTGNGCDMLNFYSLQWV